MTFRALTLVCSLAFAGVLSAEGQPSVKRYTAEEYITMWKDVAVRKMKEHGIPASITLAQGLLESGNGNSKLAREGNNHFGIKCTPDWTGGKTYHDDDAKGECFRKYKDAAQSYDDHAKFLQRKRYEALFALKPTDYKGWAHGLKKAGYATDPNYAPKLISLIERYELNKLDRGVDVSYKPAGGSAPAPARSGKRPTSSGDVITIGAGRSVELFEGRIKYVQVKTGESFGTMARQVELTPGLLARWNDLEKDASLSEGQRIFIQPKRNASKTTALHTASEGESLWSVSQEHGVKLARLAKYNGLDKDARLKAGQKVHLRKPKR